MTDSTRLETITDECQIHGTDINREYNFGFGDATVLIHDCGCCTAYKDDGFLGGRLFHSDSKGKNWNDAQAFAVLSKIQNQVEDAPFK